MPSLDSELEKLDEETDAAEIQEPNKLKVKLGGFMRLGYRSVLQDDASPDFVGQNDGFYVESARLNVDLKGDTISGRVSLDGAVNRFDERNTAEGNVEVSMLDAFLNYHVSDKVNFRVGQFRPAYDLEMERTRDKMVFVDRAVYNRGVRGVDGFNLRGLGLSREVGVALFGKRGCKKSWHWRYQLALTNGENADEIVNDNEYFAGTGRFEFGYKSNVLLGLAGRKNRRTTGAAPDKIDQIETSNTIDLQLMRKVGSYQFGLEGAISHRQIEVAEVAQEPSVQRLGYHAGTILSRGAVALAYRYAVFDPTFEFDAAADGQLSEALDTDTLTHHTVGLSVRPDEGPLTLQVNFTIAQESDERAYANDRVDLLAQLVF